jgi:hypothetical protein
MNIQSLETIRVPVLGLPFGNLEKKCHLDVAVRIYCTPSPLRYALTIKNPVGGGTTT